ncbi:hypothetical protein ABKA04_004572 [Annulohypoxylon sp. FPYF3050]
MNQSPINRTLSFHEDMEIRNFAHECDDIFYRILRNQAAQSSTIVEVLHQQFKQWVDNLNVYASPSLSLDASLVYSESLRHLITQLLQVLKRSLLRIESLENESDPEDKNESLISVIEEMSQPPGADPSSRLVESLKVLESGIDSLLQLGIAIQQSSANTLTQRINSFVKRKDDGLLEEIIYLHLRHRLGSRPQEGRNGAALSLCRQLAHSVSFRYFGVLYTQSHAAKKRDVVGHEKSPRDGRVQRVQSPGSTQRGKAPENIRPHLASSKPVAFAEHLRQHNLAQSDTSPSMPDSQDVRQRYTIQQAGFFKPESVISIPMPNNIRYPKIPDFEEDAQDAVCPYCCKRHDKVLYEKQEWWKHHVDVDLQLYTCISEDCIDPPQLFARFEDWKVHMDGRHSEKWIREVHTPISWRCRECKECPWFEDEAAIEEHIERQHPEYGEGPELEVQKALFEEKPPRPVHTCPICNLIPDKIEVVIQPNGQGLPTVQISDKDLKSLRNELLRHVGEHLKQIGFMCIRYLNEEDDTDSQASTDEKRRGLPEGTWLDGEWTPPVPPYMDDEYPNYSSIRVDELDNPVDWASLSTKFKVTRDRHFMVSLGRNKNFVGREVILQQLLGRIPPGANRDDCQRTTLEGLGGVGKTQIALEVAYQVRDQYPDCSVFWVPAVDATRFENAYRDIGRHLGVTGIEDSQADVKTVVKAALSRENAGEWLLIVDNADDIELLFEGVALLDYLPFSRKGSILFTTRNHETTVGLDIPQEYSTTITEMNDDEAKELLRIGLKESQMRDAESTRCLLDFLANLPLAIKQASAYMASNTNVTTSQYIRFCQSSHADMIDLLSRNFEDRYRYKHLAERQNPIATTWLISFEHISHHNPLAAVYLKSMSLLAEKDIPLSLLPKASKLQIAEAIGTLKSYAFIAERSDQDSFDMHRLVRLAMRNWLQTNGEWQERAANVFQYVNEEYPWPEHENRSIWTRYLPHAQAIVELEEMSDDKEASASLLFNVAESYSKLGKYNEGERLYRQTVDLLDQLLVIKGNTKKLSSYTDKC